MKMVPFCTSSLNPLLLQACSLLLPLILLGITYSSSCGPEASLDFDKRMKQLKTGHATVLATWAGLNIIAGGILMFTVTDDLLSYFYAMNCSWGLINLAVAWFLYAHHNEVFNQPQTLLQQMDHQRHVEKMMFFSIGLDMAFIASGFALQQHGYTSGISYQALWKGFGTSVILQGAFLLVQDTIFYQLHLKNRNKVYPLWQQRTEGR